MDSSLSKLAEISITVRITENPLPVINKIFEIKKGSKFIISRTIRFQENIECGLKEYIYRNQPNSSHDISLIFKVSGNTSKYSEISEFLYSKLKNFKRILIIFENHESELNTSRIKELLEKYSEDNT